jgi:hypothetical protein
MTETGPGADPRGSTWDNPSWSSKPEEQPPNPWSRQAAQPDGATPGPAAPQGSRPADPYAAPEPAGFEPVQPGFDPQPTPPYGGGAGAYGDPAAGYGPVPSYPTPPPAYGSNPYETPYQPAYGGVSPYGAVAPSHPQASTAMIFGILGIVFGFSCGLGGLLGIPGIVLGRRARREIDAQPGRYAGRSQAVAGIVTGTIGVVVAVLVTVLIVVAIAAGIATGEY